MWRRVGTGVHLHFTNTRTPSDTLSNCQEHGNYCSFAPFRQRLLPMAPAIFFFRRVSQTIPGEISRFENLTTIEADNNELSSLPSALASMPIYRLSLRRNSLSSAAGVDGFLAPPSIAPPGSLPLSLSIRELDLSSNGLGEVPASIFACRGLQVGVMLLSLFAVRGLFVCR